MRGAGLCRAERKANRKEIAKSRSKYYKHIVLTIPNEKSKRLHEAWYMSQERSGKNGRGSPLDVAVACGRCSLVSNFVFTFTTSCKVDNIAGRRSGEKAAELPQQGPHLTLHGRGGRLVLIFSYRLHQLIKAGVGVSEVQMAEDASQCG